MKLFNQQRRKLMKGSRIQKYLLYAIGEIILVVIGILLAITINNANETSKNNLELKTILKIYRNDLAKDTLTLGLRIQELEHKNKLYGIFMSDTVTISDYGKYPGGISLTLQHFPIETQTKGLTLLENYLQTNDSDRNISELLIKHKNLSKLINTIQEGVNEDISDNMNYYKNNEPWIADVLNNKFTNPNFHAYLISDNHKSRLAIQKALLINNLSRYVTNYYDFAKRTLDEIE